MKYFLCACLCILAAGCATTAPQRDATEAFGLATERLGRMGEDEFAAVRSGIIRMNKYQAILDTGALSKDFRYDAPATPLNTAERISACKTLRMYGDLLMRLASDDRTQFVRRAALVFMDSASETLGRSLDADQTAAIDNVVAGLARFWTDKRKADSIRAVVLSFENVVNTLADRLMADFVLDGSPDGFLNAYDASARRLQDLADSLLDSGKPVGADGRHRAVNAHYMAQNNLLRAKEIGLRMQTAIMTFRKANAEIVSGVRNNACDAEKIREYGRLIQQLGNLKQILPR
jgi:hypothetical protein